MGRFNSLGLASTTERSANGSFLTLNFEKSIDLEALNKNLKRRLNCALTSKMRYLATFPRASITDSQENEKVKEMDAKKKITIKIKEPTIPKIFERLVKINAPTRPPDED